MIASHYTDILILGGGPAGSATASWLLGFGYSVTIVERASCVARKVGEAVPPSIQPELVLLGLWQEFLAQRHLPAWSVKSAWGSDGLSTKEFTFHPFGSAWHLDRASFDALLLETAVARGAALIRGVALTEARRQGERHWNLEFACKGQILRIQAGFIVDATGRSAVFARKNGYRRKRQDRLVALAAHWRDDRPDESDVFTLIEARENGWWYAARLPHGWFTGVFMTDGDFLPSGAQQLYDLWQLEWSQTVHAHGMAKQPVDILLQTWPAESASLERLDGEGWLAVGDAACSFDPLSSQGVCSALESGRLAAAAIESSLTNGSVDLRKYDAGISARKEDYNRLKLAYYLLETRWPDSEFWKRRHSTARVFRTHRAVRYS